MKIKRQSRILELIRNNDIRTQDELAELLNADGYNVTQATVSRDIRELKLTKIGVSGGFKYAEMRQAGTDTGKRLARVLKEGIVSVDYAQNILVIKTLQGMAMAVAAAVDAMDNSEIIGTIAGDDTVLCVVKTEEKAIKTIERLKTDLSDTK